MRRRAHIMKPPSVMWQKVTDLPTPVTVEGRKYQVTIEGLQRKDGTWAGRLIFSDGKDARPTGQERSQPNRKALEYWATGLEKIYLEGAFRRASEEDLEAEK